MASTAGGSGPRKSANVRSPSKASTRARTSSGVSPGAGFASRWYLATARWTFSPAFANAIRSRTDSGSRNG